MKLTQNDMPASVFRAIETMDYSGRDVERFASITELITPPYALHLKESCEDSITLDAQELIAAFVGNAVHQMLALSNKKRISALVEERLAIEIDGLVISGCPDLYEAGMITDYKCTKCSSFNEKARDEWEFQLNCYALLCRHAGYRVLGLQIDCIFLDWSKVKTSNANYPSAPCVAIPFVMWRDDDIIAELRKRIARLKAARAGELFDCSAAERWDRPSIYVIMHKDRKTAVNARITDLVEANAEQDRLNREHKTGHYIQLRPGERVRCEHYCNVRSICPSFARHCAEKANPKNQEDTGNDQD